jgi:hypothetical protein
MNLPHCHVERKCQSGSDRDISYCFLCEWIQIALRDSSTPLRSAQNDK